MNVDAQPDPQSNSTTARVLSSALSDRHRIVNWFLVLMLVLVLVGLGLQLVQSRADSFTIVPFLPNLLLLLATCISLWLNNKSRLRAATLVISAGLLITASTPVLVAGMQRSESVLDLYYIPMILAALLLNRAALYAVGIITIAVTAISVLLQAAGLQPGTPAEVIG